MEYWHLLHTKLRRERQVAVLLHQRGFVIYLPLVWGNPAHALSTRQEPYFPGYLFVRMDLQSIEPDIIRWSPGLKGVVEFGHEPARVSHSFVGELQQRLERMGNMDGPALEGAGRVELVQIVDGPFAGYEGVFSLSLSGPERAHILLACVQREHGRLSTKPARNALFPNR